MTLSAASFHFFPNITFGCPDFDPVQSTIKEGSHLIQRTVSETTRIEFGQG